jgi:phosphomannomutase
MCEDGSFFGEEYTLVAVADYVLSKRKGNTVSNLSSTRALRDVTLAQGGSYQASAVGEVNVVNLMKATHAVIGGEGNGGIIVPDLHYGRDALIGIALFLSLLAERRITPSQLRLSYPHYEMAKEKISLPDPSLVRQVLEATKSAFTGATVDTTDGVKVDLPEGWVHLRPSNTEPIIRVYAESSSPEAAAALAKRAMDVALQILNTAKV